MDKDKKKRGGRAYLNDFERDLTGRYHYRGKMYHYRGTLPRQRVLGLLWAGARRGPGAASGGGMPGRTGTGTLLLCAAALCGGLCGQCLGLLGAGPPDRPGETLYGSMCTRRRWPNCPCCSMLTAVFSAAAALMCLVHILLNGASWQRVVFILLAVTATGVQVALRRFLGVFSWECGNEGQMSANEKQ